MKIAKFGSGYAVYDGNTRITPALAMDVAKRHKLIQEMQKKGFTIVYNPDHKSTAILTRFYKSYNPKAKVKRVKIDNEVIHFVG